MPKQNTKTTVPLDVVPERRTERFPPRFRPVGRFCEVQIPIVTDRQGGRDKSAPRPYERDPTQLYSWIMPISISVEQSFRYFRHMVGSGVYQCRAYLTIAHAL